MKVERRFKKKKEKKPKEEAFVVLGEWTNGGEEMSKNSRLPSQEQQEQVS